MVVPGNPLEIQYDSAIEVGVKSTMDNKAESDAHIGSELKEVQKLQELVRRLEIQNQELKIKRNQQTTNSEKDPGIDNHISALNSTGVMNNLNLHPEKGDIEIMADLQSKLKQITSEKENIPTLRTDAQVQYEKLCSDSKQEGQARLICNDEDSCFYTMDVSSERELEDSAAKMTELNPSDDLENVLDETGLDEVEVLELGSCSDDDEDCWLYVSPKKMESEEPKPDSPLKWCRQVLDHHSPETEVACQTLIGKLDQASRWKTLYCSPLASPSAHNSCTDHSFCNNTLNSPGCLKSTNKPILTCGSSGYLSIHSALSSQSSVDSELSTSDDSISMGYKLQDLTDVQVMARLQEESLRQDYASSSASVSRRSSSASLHSLRRGTFSDQEFDTYSLEDEDDCDCSLSFRSTHRYSPSPLSSPRCQSPSSTSEHLRASTSRIRPPRRSIQNTVQDRMKHANCEDELRHSMPNLAKTSLRSLEAVRSSRSLESDLQGPGSRLTRIQPSSMSTPPSKLRYGSSSGQSSLSARQPVKAGGGANSMLVSKPQIKSSGYNSANGTRKLQSSVGMNPTTSGAVSRAGNFSASIKHPPAKSQISGVHSTPKSKMIQPSRRSVHSSKTNSIPNDDDSWKEGCY
ncbi:SLAIN motif-containing protein-like [Bombina bombina]|uniref:SLAIN motif-containing protein-like n=1 Tax=Bombina bombina TaxID=8345 RepID=UPI00235AA603|nr:SLAIN motif-containing protein-like [Bombina bombina]